MNRHDFQQLAKQFRAGKVTLEDFANQVFPVNDSKSTSDDSEVEINNRVAAKGLPPRPHDAHKGDFGRVLCIGGSDGMAGAISLCGMAALRSGSGLVKVAVPESIQDVVAQFSPCFMTVFIDDTRSGRFSKRAFAELIAESDWADVIAIGPGMGESKSLVELMARLYAEIPQPMIIDADGLNNLAVGGAELKKHAGLRILTPHPGEFQRLAPGQTTDRVELEKRAGHLALENDVTIVLKGHRTFITNGDASWHNSTGNPGMATGGSGDVLTGMITSLVGQGIAPMDAAKLAVEIHGTAGDLAARRYGQVSMIASDIIECLPSAFGV